MLSHVQSLVVRRGRILFTAGIANASRSLGCNLLILALPSYSVILSCTYYQFIPSLFLLFEERPPSNITRKPSSFGWNSTSAALDGNPTFDRYQSPHFSSPSRPFVDLSQALCCTLTLSPNHNCDPISERGSELNISFHFSSIVDLIGNSGVLMGSCPAL